MISLFKRLVLISNVLPVFAGFWLALYYTDMPLSSNWKILVLALSGSLLVIAGALALNNWYEVDLDREMARTIKRPTVTGAISLRTVLIIGIVLTVIGFILLLMTTWEAALYGFIGWFTYVVLYTLWTKRKYTLNTVVGSISGAVTPLIGWSAIASSLHVVPMGLALIIFIWQVPHTFAIAMKRVEEYRAANVPMLPVVYGFTVTKRQMLVYIISLLPIPLFLTSLGPVFIIITTLLNVGWLALSIQGFYTKNDMKWAHHIFIYSLNYLLILFVVMIAVTMV